MSEVRLNLVVLRCRDITVSSAFYSKLGLNFELHRHGNGPEHYAAESAGTVLEIYPATERASTGAVRIGFSVPGIDAIINDLAEFPNAVAMSPKDSEWGRRAVLSDPDGHRVELVERNL